MKYFNVILHGCIFHRISYFDSMTSFRWTKTANSMNGHFSAGGLWPFFASCQRVFAKRLSRVTIRNKRNYYDVDSCVSTSLPLASTRWVRSTFSSLCPISCNQRPWKSQQHWNKFWGMPRIKPGPLGEKQECCLCAMQPPPPFMMLTLYTEPLRRRAESPYDLSWIRCSF